MNNFLGFNVEVGDCSQQYYIVCLTCAKKVDLVFLPPAPRHTPMKIKKGVPVMTQWKRIRLGTMRLQVPSLASLSGLRIRHCCGLWCRLQTQLRSHVAVAVV